MSDTRIVTVKKLLEDGTVVDHDTLVKAEFTFFTNLPGELQAEIMGIASTFEPYVTVALIAVSPTHRDNIVSQLMRNFFGPRPKKANTFF